MKAASIRPSSAGGRSGLIPVTGKRFGSWTVRLLPLDTAGFCTAGAVAAAAGAAALVGAGAAAAVGFAAAGVGLLGAAVAGAAGAGDGEEQACSRLAPVTALAATASRTKWRRSNLSSSIFLPRLA